MTTIKEMIEKQTTINENVEKVHEAGFQAGKEAGQKAEYDRFWDNHQFNGNRTDYNNFFGGLGWNEENLKPKYDVKPVSAYMMFGYCGYNGDLDEVFKNRGLELDFSGCGNTNYAFFQTRISIIGEINCSSSYGVDSMFNSTNIITVKNLIPPPIAMNANSWQSELVNLGIGGDITKNFNLSRCGKLSAESVQSVIDHLADLTGQTTQTITWHSNIANTLSDEQQAAIFSKNWTLA